MRHHPGIAPDLNIPQLTLTRSEQAGVQVIALRGELDLRAVGELETALAAAGEGARVCLDLTELQFIDSTGLAAVIRGHQALQASDGRLAVACSDHGAVRRTFATTGLTTLLTVVDDRAAALAALAV